MRKFIIVCKECEHGNEIGLSVNGRDFDWQDRPFIGKIKCAVCGAQEEIRLDDELEG